jgi:uncharacterized protein (TIGR02646 family)
MRHIDITDLAVSAAWQTEAATALSEARAKSTQQARAKYINSRSEVWSKLKPKLEDQSNRKCWYCESREIRSDRAVDHFRPKNNVRDADPPHDGYWWLAFDLTNYRLCCTFCNSRRTDRGTGVVGGKGDYFPVHDETKRLQPEAKSFHKEGALLLDPCNPTDVSLLWFEDDGSARSKYDKSDKALAFKRAELSIDYYNLNEREIKDERKAIYATIKELIEDGDKYFEDSFAGVPTADHALGRVVMKLAALTSMDAEFSAFSIATIKGFRGPGREWMDAIDSI